MGLADELLEDAREMEAKALSTGRESMMRRAVSTAYYAVFHLFVEDFVASWPYIDQRARLARMFDHRRMREAPVVPENKQSLTPAEIMMVEIKTLFARLQADRNSADYDRAWAVTASEVDIAVARAEEVFSKWQSIRTEDVARNYLLSMFGANR